MPEIEPMSPQQSIAHYRIVSKLGAGGPAWSERLDAAPHWIEQKLAG
jgi:hypothetical protein